MIRLTARQAQYDLFRVKSQAAGKIDRAAIRMYLLARWQQGE
jgi:hypothetical protein